MSVGLDLAPHYFYQLERYRKANPGTKLGSPGRYQGFNTGVVLYRLDRMRASSLYNSYLNSKQVTMLQEKFKYKISLAEQDFFTNLGYVHPEMFQVLPCQFNVQESIQYMTPPFEDIFDSYHYCCEKKDLKIAHINGCGPMLSLCKHQKIPGSRYYNISDDYEFFIHTNMKVFWTL